MLKYTTLFIAVLCFTFVWGKGKEAERTKTQKIIEKEVKLHPLMEICDLYKFLYQAEFGSAHAGLDSAMAAEWMNSEWDSANGSVVNENLVDTISPVGKMVRVNIRPYKLKGLSKEKLVRAFVKTAQNYKGDKRAFLKLWSFAEDMGKRIPFTKKELREYMDKMKKLGYPAVHHSKVYEKAYGPSYRVISTRELETLF